MNMTLSMCATAMVMLVLNIAQGHLTAFTFIFTGFLALLGTLMDYLYSRVKKRFEPHRQEILQFISKLAEEPAEAP
jgi:hypothetical protein